MAEIILHHQYKDIPPLREIFHLIGQIHVQLLQEALRPRNPPKARESCWISTQFRFACEKHAIQCNTI